MWYNPYYKDGREGGELATFETVRDHCKFQQYDLPHSICGKYEVKIKVLGTDISFQTTLETEQDDIYKKVRLAYHSEGVASEKILSIIEEFYTKKSSKIPKNSHESINDHHR